MAQVETKEDLHGNEMKEGWEAGTVVLERWLSLVIQMRVDEDLNTC